MQRRPKELKKELNTNLQIAQIKQPEGIALVQKISRFKIRLDNYSPICKEGASFYKITISPYLVQLLSSLSYRKYTTGESFLEKHISTNPLRNIATQKI